MYLSVKKIIILFLIYFGINGCSIRYSFTGAAIAPEIKTINIAYFPNYASLVQPVLSQVLTEKIKDKFQYQAHLSLIKGNGDLSLEGSITGYSIQPIAIQGNDQAAMNRLTITVSAKFSNSKNEKQNFDTSFSRYADYSSSTNLSSVEEDLIRQICEQLAEDIFNKAVNNW